MNQYRCETCDDCDKSPPWWYCCRKDISLEPCFAIPLIELVGCASHSDFQSEREKVLDELRKFVAKMYDEGYKNPMATFDVAVQEYKISLRQEGKVEK